MSWRFQKPKTATAKDPGSRGKCFFLLLISSDLLSLLLFRLFPWLLARSSLLSWLFPLSRHFPTLHSFGLCETACDPATQTQVTPKQRKVGVRFARVWESIADHRACISLLSFVATCQQPLHAFLCVNMRAGCGVFLSLSLFLSVVQRSS